MKKAYGYLRVSTEEQFESGLGLAAQRERIAAYCQLQGLELAECFEDAGISGRRERDYWHWSGEREAL